MAEPSSLYDQAEGLKRQGDLEGAVAKLAEALEQDPTYALAHSASAVVLQRLGRHEEAIAHAVRAAELEPGDPFSFTALSVTYQRAYAGTGEHRYIPLAEEAMARSRQLEAGY